MQRKSFDLWVGLFVLLGAAALMFLALKAGNMSSLSLGQTYAVTSRFDNIGGLKPQAPVKSAGVVVGRVGAISFDDKTFQATVTLNLESRYKFPKDSSAKILTSGLLGEQYIGLEPGGDTQNLADGDRIKMTQSAVILENLISQFLFSKAAESKDNQKMRGMIRIIAALALICVLGGCASSGNPNDPFEGYNRAMYSFNDKLDRYALKPTAQAYQTVTPSFVQTGIGNFFGNLADVWTAVNNLLQGKGSDGMSDLGRVIINSTLGLGGLIDIGTEAGLPKHKEDFGQTLGKWGVKPGPYIVLPLLGPSTLRDTVALPVDFKGDLWLYEDPVWVRNTGSVIRVVDKRASLLDAGNLIEDAALDPYQFLRDAYLQRRKNQVYDGDIPDDDDDKPADKLQDKPEGGSDGDADKLKENAK